MKIKIILSAMLLIISNIAAMEVEQKGTGLENMLLEPASLVFQAAWHAVRTGQNLELTGAEHIVDLGNKLKDIQQCTTFSVEEKKLLINL